MNNHILMKSSKYIFIKFNLKFLNKYLKIYFIEYDVTNKCKYEYKCKSVYADVVQVKLSQFLDDEPKTLEMFEGWRNWTLRDIVRILKDMAKIKGCYGMAAVAMGNIVLRKLLEAVADPNVPFKVI